jgi:Rv2525c-like, glycoside hydrolase-like domain
VQTVTRPSRSIVLRATLLVLGAAVLLALFAAPASAGKRVVRFDGRVLQVPASWPVYRLSQHPRMCVRLDRRAVYLGTPAAQQSCPAEAIGRRRAIVVEPRSAAAPSSLLPRARISATTRARSGTIFTGLGFDACSTPSARSMSAWKSSPYRAIGVYIGGENRACSQPNLTPEWVAAQTAAGWHLIPTYVGLQAPTSACSSCAKLSSSQATAQGVASAIDAVEEANAVAMGPGSPIYFDMESYSRTSSATAATLAFLEAWTKKLHALGYLSGVYSSSASGIADLGDQVGTGYELPDHLWIANWNGSTSTSDPVVPSSAWTQHQRIHQYRGGHNETYGGVTINIDNNSVDGATVGNATLPPVAEEDPVGALELAGAAGPGQVRIRGWALDANAPTQALAIRLVVGGREGDPEVATYELGSIANLARRDVRLKYPEAGSRHGFDVSLPTVKSGRQRVCAYALDVDPGEDTLLGCKGVTIPVAVQLSNLKAGRNRVQLRLTCGWPEGTECPGQIVLRARFRVPVAHRGRGPRTRPVTRVIGRAPFRLSGGQGQTYRVALTPAGRKLLRLRGLLRTHVLVAIPGGRRIGVVELRG